MEGEKKEEEKKNLWLDKEPSIEIDIEKMTLGEFRWSFVLCGAQ